MLNIYLILTHFNPPPIYNMFVTSFRRHCTITSSTADIQCHYFPVKGKTVINTPTPMPTPSERTQCRDTFINGNADLSISADYYKNCQGLQSTLKFNDAITSIGAYAFMNCSSLVTVNLPANLQVIYKNAFDNCTNIQKIWFKNNYISQLGSYCFQRCYKLSTFNIPEYIGSSLDCPIYKCTSLSQMSVCQTVGCSYTWSSYRYKLMMHTDGRTVICTNTKQVLLSIHSITTISIPTSVNRLGVNAYRYTLLTGRITIPANVLYLDRDCFRECYYIYEVIIVGKVQSINDVSFRECRGVTSFTIKNEGYAGYEDIYGNVYATVNGIICDASKERLLFNPNNRSDMVFNIPYSVKSFSPQLFDTKSGKIKEFRITSADGKTQMKTGSGMYLSIKDGILVYSGDRLVKFPPMHTVDRYTIDATYKTIDEGCFANCHITTNLHCSDVTSIGRHAFYQIACASITFNDISKVVYIDEWAFHSAQITGEFIYPAIEYASSQTFSYADITKLVVSEGVVSIGSSFCQMCTYLTELTLPSTLEYIGQEAFSYTQLNELKLPEVSLREVDRSAFLACSTVRYIYVPACVRKVHDNAFGDCTSAEWVIIADCNTCCHKDAFRSNDNKLQPECVSTYVFTYHRCLPGLRPVYLFLKIIMGAFMNDCCEVWL